MAFHIWGDALPSAALFGVLGAVPVEGDPTCPGLLGLPAVPRSRAERQLCTLRRSRDRVAGRCEATTSTGGIALILFPEFSQGAGDLTSF